jgi:hypothetical protein
MEYLITFAPGDILILTWQMIPVYNKLNINININIHQTLKV